MKKTLSSVIFLCLLNAVSYSQDCKYTVNKEDKFTNTVTQETEPIEICAMVANSEGIKIKDIGMILRLENNKRYFTLTYRSVGKAHPLFGGATSKLILLLDNGDKIEMIMSGIMSDRKVNGMKAIASTHFEMPEDIYFKLKSHNITDIRASSMVNPFDFKIDDGIKTSKYFGCIK